MIFACDFSEGMALVGMADREGRIAYEVIDKEGQNVFPVMLTNCRLQGCFLVVYSCTKICGNTIVLVWIKKGKPCCIFPPRYRK